MKCYLVHDRTHIEVLDPDVIDLDFMKSCVEGYIECVEVHGGDIWINEEGEYQFPERVNWQATDIAGAAGRPDLLFRPLKGPALITGHNGNGATTAITPELERIVLTVASEAGVVVTGA